MLIEDIPFEADISSNDPGRLRVGLVYRRIIAHTHPVIGGLVGCSFLFHLRRRRGQVDFVDPFRDFSTSVVTADRFEMRDRMDGQKGFDARLLTNDEHIWTADRDTQSTCLQVLRSIGADRVSE
jgi:hypothetical protein